ALDRVDGHEELAGDLGVRQHRRQVAQYLELTLAQRLEQLRPRYPVHLLPSFEDRKDLRGEPPPRRAPADPLGQRRAQRRRRLEERADAALRLGELEGPFERLGRRVRAADGGQRDRFEDMAVDPRSAVEALLEAGEGRERVGRRSLGQLDARECQEEVAVQACLLELPLGDRGGPPTFPRRATWAALDR